jgi:hypothetical protein
VTKNKKSFRDIYGKNYPETGGASRSNWWPLQGKKHKRVAKWTRQINLPTLYLLRRLYFTISDPFFHWDTGQEP